MDRVHRSHCYPDCSGRALKASREPGARAEGFNPSPERPGRVRALGVDPGSHSTRYGVEAVCRPEVRAISVYGRVPEDDDLSAAIQRGEADEGVLDDIARRHSMEIVGPVPDSYV